MDEAHATSANSADLVEFAEVASATCSPGETPLRSRNNKQSEMHVRARAAFLRATFAENCRTCQSSAVRGAEKHREARQSHENRTRDRAERLHAVFRRYVVLVCFWKQIDTKNF